ncbi:unnamed protein product [Prorocentrum cordatum]|uniref:EF-hand domain-containing protein n=1 Tax=Prorocentrum cordatum TaxID=2364126 RepID=A0ABN9W1J5_9DINO|nr:unnamed protein product [Polarella glacialis]
MESWTRMNWSSSSTYRSGLVCHTSCVISCRPTTHKDLFDILDRDKDGQVGAVEFVEGICKIALSSVPVETMQMLSLLRQQQAKTLEVRQHVNELQHILTKTTLPPWHRSWSAPPGAVPLGKED